MTEVTHRLTLGLVTLLGLWQVLGVAVCPHCPRWAPLVPLLVFGGGLGVVVWCW